MTVLAKYEAACAALAEAVTAQEVMAVHTSAKAIEAVARVAQNFELEVQAVKLRTSAEARLGTMLAEGEAQGLIAPRGRPSRKDSESESFPATLKEVGVPGKLAARARSVAGIGQQAVDLMLARFESESQKRGRLALDVISSATAKRNADNRRKLAQELSDHCAALNPHGRRFPILYADPAWRRKAGIGDRAYENSYSTMGWKEIIAMGPAVQARLLPDAWLFIWIPRAHLLALHPVEIETPLGKITVKMPLAWAVAQAFGADDYSTCFVWTKTDEDNPDAHGTGLIAFDQDELLLLFKRGGGLPKPDTDKKPRSNYRAPAGRHSEKPTYYREMINAMSGGLPVLELFAREDDEHVLPPNFFTWGNQSKNTANEPYAEVTVKPDDAEMLSSRRFSADDIGDLPDFLKRRRESSPA